MAAMNLIDHYISTISRPIIDWKSQTLLYSPANIDVTSIL